MEQPFPVLKDIKVGDKFVRCIGPKCELKIDVVVTKVLNAVVWVAIEPDQLPEQRHRAMALAGIVNEALNYEKQFTKEELEKSPEWTFSINTGGEIDTVFGWDGINTGTFLRKTE